MVTDNRQKQVGAAYVPFKTVDTATAALAAAGVPRVLDRSAFPSFSGSMKGWLLSAFQFLGFIDGEGNTQPSLYRWVREPDARPEIMASILREKYAAVVALAEDSGTPQQFRTEIEKLGVSGSTTQKAIRFFIAAADFAGINVPITWKKMRVPLTATKRRRASEMSVEEILNGGRKVKPGGGGAAATQSEVVTLAGGGTVTITIDANLLTLTPEDREWLFGLIDDFKSYAVEEDEDDIDAEDGVA
ncbi:MAG: DUF5343 domain-containing protein [Dehalococcoidia bacterium]|nr:DUF5343 domain-containing protein [Dehalococcoidia bacterium]